MRSSRRRQNSLRCCEVVAVGVEIELAQQHVIGIEAGIDAHGGLKSAREEARADERYQSQRHFRGDEHGAQAIAARPAVPLRPPAFMRAAQIEAAHLQCGARPAASAAKTHTPAVNASTAEIGTRVHGDQLLHGAGRHQILQRMAHPRRDSEAKRRAGAGEQQALRQHLACKPSYGLRRAQDAR
jgi:hypothetical protein